MATLFFLIRKIYKAYYERSVSSVGRALDHTIQKQGFESPTLFFYFHQSQKEVRAKSGEEFKVMDKFSIAKRHNHKCLGNITCYGINDVHRKERAL